MCSKSSKNGSLAALPPMPVAYTSSRASKRTGVPVWLPCQTKALVKRVWYSLHPHSLAFLHAPPVSTQGHSIDGAQLALRRSNTAVRSDGSLVTPAPVVQTAEFVLGSDSKQQPPPSSLLLAAYEGAESSPGCRLRFAECGQTPARHVSGPQTVRWHPSTKIRNNLHP